MTSSPPPLLRSAVFAAFMLAWAAAAYFGSSGRGSVDFNTAVGVAPAVVLALLLARQLRPLGAALGGLLALAALAWLWPLLRQNVALLYFTEHLGTHLALAALFGRTLIGPGEPLVTRLARAVHGGELSPRKLRYTRQATVAWTGFFIANATASTLLFALAPLAVWSFYASLLTAPLVGLMFIAEHLWRLRVLPPEERPRLVEVARAWRQRRAMPGP